MKTNNHHQLATVAALHEQTRRARTWTEDWTPEHPPLNRQNDTEQPPRTGKATRDPLESSNQHGDPLNRQGRVTPRERGSGGSPALRFLGCPAVGPELPALLGLWTMKTDARLCTI